MKISIHQPVGFSEVGGRANNEDSIFPLPNATNQVELFIVCDGVGGQSKGEAASSLACESIAEFFMNHPPKVADEGYMIRALEYTHEKFKQKEQQNPETHGMATTMALVHFHEAGVSVVHIGDSRVYHIRDNEILSVTEDHKFITLLLKEGRISAEEAMIHPDRNQITKAISADRRDTPTVQIISDIRPNDYFFLCSDGVLEQIHDDLLLYHLRNTEDNRIEDVEKLENIRQECLGKTRDNFSAYLIRVQGVEGKIPLEYLTSPLSTVPSNNISFSAKTQFNTFQEDTPTQFVRTPTAATKSTEVASTSPKKNLLLIGAAIFLVGMALLAWYFVEKSSLPSPKPLVEKTIDSNHTKPSTTQALSEAIIRPKKQVSPRRISTNEPTQEKLFPVSKNYNFTIFKKGNDYFSWEPAKKKEKKIVFDEESYREGVCVAYSYDEKSLKLYLIRPDKRFEGIESLEIIGNTQIIYEKEGIKHKIDPNTGKEPPSIQELKTKKIKKNSV